MTRWLVAAIPLLAAVAAAWLRFSGGLAEDAFRSIFLVTSVCWFALALRAETPRSRQKSD